MARKRTKPGKIRLTEVAKLAGVSPITASRFFRTPEALSINKRVRVESAAKELGYVPNLAARALASHRTEVIGVVIPSLTNSVFADVLRGIYDSSEQSRYSIQLANTRYSILQEEKLKDGYSKIAIDFNVNADIGPLIRFLLALVTNPNVLEIRQLNINAYMNKNQVVLQPRITLAALIRKG